MKTGLVLLAVIFISYSSIAQTASTDSGYLATVHIQKDQRIDILGEKMYAYNAALKRNVLSGRGYRLMVLSTNDRNMAMQLRSRLLQQYPEHKVYMIYQNPFIKLKMGNFVDKSEAENFKKHLLAQRMLPGNIYVLPENIELKPEPEEELE